MAWSPLANPAATRAVLKRHGLTAKHRLGQNFLVDDSVVGGILRLAGLDKESYVLEVGPGIGTLTAALLDAAGRVCSVEADPSLAPVLEETCGAAGERFTLVQGDALKVVPEGVPGAPTHFVSNLPYQIAAPLILKVFREMPSVRRAVVMVQLEVAQRMAASPGSKEYGAYTAKLALHARPDGGLPVPPSCFMPQPHVESAVVGLTRWRVVGAPETTPAVIDAAFAQRRKTIRNSMAASGYDKAMLDEAFAACLIDPGCRAETLSVDDFVRLARALGKFSNDVT